MILDGFPKLNDSIKKNNPIITIKIIFMEKKIIPSVQKEEKLRNKVLI